ncbi:hypothetical protein B0H10DRAFT_2080586 [Mycena sp. CBHHK59/15]|nr:hypothetical protein B0H10DRAFT_2080586 [Mycena sp. CBHHK59/15]
MLPCFQHFSALGLYLLAALAPIFLFSVPPAVALVIVPRNLNASLIDPTCLAVCQPALTTQSKCGTPPDFKCLCTNANGNDFAQCMDCVVSLTPNDLAESAGKLVLTDFYGKCAENNVPISSLTLSVSAAAASPTVPAKNSGNRVAGCMKRRPLYSISFLILISMGWR